jgi:hypothetical protein
MYQRQTRHQSHLFPAGAVYLLVRAPIVPCVAGIDARVGMLPRATFVSNQLGQVLAFRHGQMWITQSHQVNRFLDASVNVQQL